MRYYKPPPTLFNKRIKIIFIINALIVEFGMEQHPIPQQITSYEFEARGDMTLKQFGKAGG